MSQSRDQNKYQRRNEAARRDKYPSEEGYWPKFAASVECQQHAADVEHGDNKTHVGDLAEVFASDNTGQCRNYCDDRVRHEQPWTKLPSRSLSSRWLQKIPAAKRLMPRH